MWHTKWGFGQTRTGLGVLLSLRMSNRRWPWLSNVILHHSCVIGWPFVKQFLSCSVLGFCGSATLGAGNKILTTFKTIDNFVSPLRRKD